MKIPCIEALPWLVAGFSFLQPAMTAIQLSNLSLVATALILGSDFNLSEISRMWLKKKGVSTLSYFFSDIKISISEMQKLYAIRVLQTYSLSGGYYIVDDTMEHHTRLCRWIHGVCCLFDHVLHTNLQSKCLVFLYYSDGGLIKFPITFRIFYKEDGSRMPWQKGQSFVYNTKNELALEMIQWALGMGFPRATVLADSWFCVEPFIKGLRGLQLPYILEAKANYNVKISCQTPKLTPTGRLAKHQFDLQSLPEFFESIESVILCGFDRDLENGKPQKVLYHTKIATVRFNAFPGKHRVVQSIDPAKGTTKYLITNQLHFEASQIISAYSQRWVVEEFFRNSKQLSDMEGATIRSEQGVTLALCLVSWIDFLLHYQNYKGITEGSQEESLSIPSIVRQAQADNMVTFIDKIQNDEEFVQKWIQVTKDNINHARKCSSELVNLEPVDELSLEKAA
ncbi:MAG: transposase [SAR324 cluster bacterium]|nr:transposase [SAR324 cluster bacterium]